MCCGEDDGGLHGVQYCNTLVDYLCKNIIIMDTL